MGTDIDEKVIKHINQKRVYKKEFVGLINEFESKFEAFNPVKNCFEISSYFASGKTDAKRKLLQDGFLSKLWLRDYKTRNGKVKNDFQGLYVFVSGEVPIYVGISKGVIGRIDQHLKGRSHNTSTLAYNIGIVRHELISGKKYSSTRHGFDFVTGVEPAKEFLRKQKLAWIHIDNAEELYLFEIFCAMKLHCWLNRFGTH